MKLLYCIAADIVLTTHFAFVAFVIVALVLIVIGGLRRWPWVRNPWFRLAHLAAIVVVVAQAWMGIICPLTVFENWLRVRAGEATYAGSFIAHWLDQLLFYEAPQWVFTLCYTVFASAVVASFVFVRPRRFRRAGRGRPRANV